MKKMIFTVIAVVVILIGIGLAFDSYAVVESGNRGLMFTFGKLDDVELKEGFHFKLPIAQEVKSITIQPVEQKVEIEVGSKGAITKDNQTVGSSIAVFYRYKAGELSKMYRDYGTQRIEDIIEKTIEETFKKTIGTYTIFDIASRQQEIIEKLKKVVAKESEQYPITVDEVKVINFDWSDQFDKQIEETMKRAQQVKQKEQELLITEQEANKRVKVAEAKKIAMITEAEGEFESTKIRAEARVLEGEGIRKYNESIAKNLNVEIKLRELEIKKIEKEKWNGQYVPLYWYAPIPVQTKNNFVGGE